MLGRLVVATGRRSPQGAPYESLGVEYEGLAVIVGRVVVGFEGVGFLVGRFGLGLYEGLGLYLGFFGLYKCLLGGPPPKIPPKKFSLPKK